MKQHMYKNQTFSLPTLVNYREMNHFVVNAIRKQLAIKKQRLREAYLSANQDPGQVEAMNDWSRRDVGKTTKN